MSLPEYSLKNRKVVWFFLFILLAGGALGFVTLGKKEDSVFVIKSASLVCSYPGATPLEVEQLVTEPIEREVQSMRLVHKITSESYYGLSKILVELDPATRASEIPQLWDELRRKVLNIQPRLPAGASPVTVADDFGGVYGIYYGLSVDGGFTWAELRDWAQRIKTALVTVDGVQKLALTAPLVAHFASLLFGERHVRETAILRVTRSADISVRDIMDGCDADLRAVMERLLRRRRRLEPVRAQVQGRVSDEMRALVRELLGLPKRQLFVTNTPTDLSFVLAMPGEFDLTGLTCKEVPPAKNVALQKGDYFAYLAQHDLLLALPYQSINPFVDLLYEAADDPDVVSIKITLYRLAGSSRIAAALAYAAEHGKQVQCLLELRARFDEQSNIDYSRMLEDAGCSILYGLTKYKVHTKLCLITRRCPGGICYYTQVGTGNYNEKTAEQYTDLMLLTSDPAIGRDAAKTFDRLARGETVGETEALWLAPEGYKPQLLAHIDAQTRLGPKGYIGIKVNSMNDADVMARLVRASEAGTEVELFVRGICCLRPGVPGRTEHISVRSIIGRYLEHERIFAFGRGEAQEVFIGSGDLLERNTMRRIEAFTAVTDPNARAEVLEVLSAMRRDNRQAWIMQPDGSYLRPEHAGEPFVSQTYLHTYFAGRTVTKSAPSAPPRPQKKLPWWRRLWIWLWNN